MSSCKGVVLNKNSEFISFRSAGRSQDVPYRQVRPFFFSKSDTCQAHLYSICNISLSKKLKNAKKRIHVADIQNRKVGSERTDG